MQSKPNFDRFQSRSATIELIPSQEGDSQVYEMSFSSDIPVKRSWGNEVLSHSPGAVDWQRLQDRAVPLLFDHDPKALLGVVEKAWLDGSKGRCQYRWSNDPEAQRRKLQVDEGVLTSASFRYEILEWEERGHDLVATKWQPIEVSLVTCPADSSVGMGRSQESKENLFPISVDVQRKEKIMSDENQLGVEDLTAVRQSEADRVRSLLALEQRYSTTLGEALNQYCQQAIDTGVSIEGARSHVLEMLGKHQSAPISRPVEALGLSKKEEKEYSLLRALKATNEGTWENAGFERECSDEIAKRLGGRTTAGFYIPIRDLKVSNELVQQRAAYAAGTPASAGRLIATDLDSSNFIDLLRNTPRCMQLGAKLLSGLVGNLDIPKQSTTGSVFWVAEGASPTDVAAQFELVNLRPKTMGILQSATRQMLLQATPDMESLIRADLLALAALEIDRVMIDGSGTGGQPRGILNTVGINSLAIGPNGGPITYDLAIDMETAVADANADGRSLNYMTNAKVVGALKKLKDGSNRPLWENGLNSAMVAGTPGALNNYDVVRTNQVPKNKTKGTGTNLSSMLFGDFSQLLMGEWGTLEILPNPYGSLYASGGIEYRALFTMDVAIRQPTAFSAITDITTT
jgi:HK97 family phage major capsid protein/HK97 family phage prohead protease